MKETEREREKTEERYSILPVDPLLLRSTIQYGPESPFDEPSPSGGGWWLISLRPCIYCGHVFVSSSVKSTARRY